MATKTQIPLNRPENRHIQAMRKAHRENYKIIKNYMLGRDIPDWFRGTSNFQGKAADRLNDSLRFDMEQRTSHRVRACLIGLGLNPMIKNGEIKFLIKLSRANDLAFLWFLFELHYKTSSSQYSINEQLILSTIAHLDMIPTLRELDRILPPAVQEEPKPRNKPSKTQIIRAADVPIPNKIRNVKSPYLQPIRLPKPYNTVNTCERKDFQVTLGEYDAWRDPNYIVPNEANRWFATYKPQTGARVVHEILKEELANIFADFETAQEDAENTTILCENHRQHAKMEEKLKVELQMKQRDECLKYFDVDGAKKEKIRARVKAQLERDVEHFQALRQYQMCSERVRTCKQNKQEKLIKEELPIMVLKGVDSFRYQQVHSSEEHFEARGGERGRYRESNPHIIGDHPSGAFVEYAKKERERGGQEKSCDSESSSESACGKRRFSMSCFQLVDGAPNKINVHINGKNTTNNNSNNKNLNAKNLRCEEDDVEPLLPCSSNVFFAAAKEHQPWYFDYQKIFQVNHPYQPQEDVKQQAVKAIDSEMSFQTKMENVAKQNIDKAVSASVKRTWRQGVKAYNANYSNAEELAAMRAENEKDEKIPLDFGQDTFDPNDTKLMSHMLKTAFEYIKKNPKFVLAGLPDAYKLPSFIYFIENRYGKRYSLRDRHRLHLKSLHILRALEKITKKIPMPKIQKLCKNPFVSYACRDYLLAKANRIKQEYYEQLDNAIMRQARVFWFAMLPYLCTSGPPKNTYFAYMPSRSVDITRFRQWKSSEFMDAKAAWDRRQREERQKVFK